MKKTRSAKDEAQIAAAVAAADAGAPLLGPTGRMRRLPKTAEPAERIACKSVQTPSGCREWRGTTSRGYGRVYISELNVQVPAHRLAYEIAFGPIPEGYFVCHRCDNPACVNPDHLFAGTNAQNMADMVSKGRQNVAKGERVKTAKLTAAQAMEIRRLTSAGMTNRVAAATFGVSTTSVSYIRTGRNWAHLAKALP